MKINSNCKLNAGNLSQKTFEFIHFFKGVAQNLKYQTDESKIILEIMGDIDISNGGILS